MSGWRCADVAVAMVVLRWRRGGGRGGALEAAEQRHSQGNAQPRNGPNGEGLCGATRCSGSYALLVAASSTGSSSSSSIGRGRERFRLQRQVKSWGERRRRVSILYEFQYAAYTV